MVEIGNGGMTPAEYRSEFSLWVGMAAPLIAGTDLVDASPATLSMYLNRKVIAVDKDRRAVQGHLVSGGRHMVFSKPLADGDVAVALFNRGTPRARFGISAHRAGVRTARSYQVHDLWTDRTHTTAGRIGATVRRTRPCSTGCARCADRAR